MGNRKPNGSQVHKLNSLSSPANNENIVLKASKYSLNTDLVTKYKIVQTHKLSQTKSFKSLSLKYGLSEAFVKSILMQREKINENLAKSFEESQILNINKSIIQHSMQEWFESQMYNQKSVWASDVNSKLSTMVSILTGISDQNDPNHKRLVDKMQDSRSFQTKLDQLEVLRRNAGVNFMSVLRPGEHLNAEVSEFCASNLRNLMSEFQAEDIFNVDEVGFVDNGSNNKPRRRITMILGCNMSGTEKTKPCWTMMDLEEDEKKLSLEEKRRICEKWVIFSNRK